MKYNIINKIEFAERSNFYETCSKQKIHIGKREYHPSSWQNLKASCKMPLWANAIRN